MTRERVGFLEVFLPIGSCGQARLEFGEGGLDEGRGRSCRTGMCLISRGGTHTLLYFGM